MANKKYISSRSDRYGANYIPAISYIFLCEKINNDLLYHNCDKNCHRYINTILHEYLVDKTSRCTDLNIIKNDIHKNPEWSTKYITEEIFRKKKKSFPDIFHDSDIYNEIRNRYFARYDKDSFTNNAIIIHVRLDDMRNKNGNNQQFIGEDNLIHLINTALEKFELNIFLMTSNNKIDKDICTDCLKKSNFKMEKDVSYSVITEMSGEINCL